MRTMKAMMVALMMMVVTSATAMTYGQAKEQALFLTDKMAYELDLTDEQYEAAYEINLDYLMAVDHRSVYGSAWANRNYALNSILAAWQFNRYAALDYFYRPVAWRNGAWDWLVYSRYDRNRFFRGRPRVYVSYRGGRNYRYYETRSWNRPAPPHRHMAMDRPMRVERDYGYRDRAPRMNRNERVYNAPSNNRRGFDRDMGRNNSRSMNVGGMSTPNRQMSQANIQNRAFSGHR